MLSTIAADFGIFLKYHKRWWVPLLVVLLGGIGWFAYSLPPPNKPLPESDMQQVDYVGPNGVKWIDRKVIGYGLSGEPIWEETPDESSQ